MVNAPWVRSLQSWWGDQACAPPSCHPGARPAAVLAFRQRSPRSGSNARRCRVTRSTSEVPVPRVSGTRKYAAGPPPSELIMTAGRQSGRAEGAPRGSGAAPRVTGRHRRRLPPAESVPARACQLGLRRSTGAFNAAKTRKPWRPRPAGLRSQILGSMVGRTSAGLRGRGSDGGGCADDPQPDARSLVLQFRCWLGPDLVSSYPQLTPRQRVHFDGCIQYSDEYFRHSSAVTSASSSIADAHPMICTHIREVLCGQFSDCLWCRFAR